ncbi:hypothetical protein GCM10008171_34820 [Methylopila jiangsuensis]|uniref:DUF1134 domain-containing protein n=1 Tax=Methylopila jiangsuensis TaxID=586230 RepID=A0A9W6JL77_9HYPH|nr:DUF1134 domain-containing protein [Methylopila jiangsuensis]MDR6284387.1 hypothetical protein [Methylopila jiangsuensis]GLK78228.1 hypothetical protein GCM10008171_34820 [Methylopila jiangsuensis]
MTWRTPAAAAALVAGLVAAGAADAQYAGPASTRAAYSDSAYGTPRGPTYSAQEVLDKGHAFFGSMSRGLGGIVERATAQWGEPNGYILGEEASGAFVGGLRYGEGTLFTRDGGEGKVYWQGPSLGFDFGGDGARTMILVYNLPSKTAIFNRFVGIDGSAYLVGGLGMTALKDYETVLVPIRTGVGARLGVNMGYLKFTPRSTWNPF